MTEANRGNDLVNLFPTAFRSIKYPAMNRVEFMVVEANRVVFSCASVFTGIPMNVTIVFGEHFALATVVDGKNAERAAPVFAPVVTLGSVEEIIKNLNGVITNLVYLV